jgi:hypothetical protein
MKLSGVTSAYFTGVLALLLIYTVATCSPTPPASDGGNIQVLQNSTLYSFPYFINLFIPRFSLVSGELYLFLTEGPHFNLARLSVYPSISILSSVRLTNTTLIDFVITPTAGYLIYCADPSSNSHCATDLDSGFASSGGQIFEFDLQTLEVNPTPIITGLPTPNDIPLGNLEVVLYNEQANSMVYFNAYPSETTGWLTVVDLDTLTYKR